MRRLQVLVAVLLPAARGLMTAVSRDDDFGILAAATELPPGRVTAAELAEAIGFPPGLIEEKLGLVEKCVALADDEHPSDLATRAVARALQALGASESDVGLVVFTGVSRDYLPSYTVALEVAHRLGLRGALAYDLTLGCAAPVVAMDQARRRGGDGRGPLSVIVTAERWSHTLSPHVEFPIAWAAHADGAAAVVLGPDAPLPIAGFAVHMRADFNRFLVIPAGGTQEPASAETVANHRHARRLFEPPPEKVIDAYLRGYQEAVGGALAQAGSSMDEVELLLMNQIRPEMRQQVQSALHARDAANIDTYTHLGHLGGADTLVGLEVAARRGRFQHPGTAIIAASSVTAFASICLRVRSSLAVPSADASALPSSVVDVA